MHLRRARAEDREHLSRLWERSVRATHHFLSESDIVTLRPLVARELASDAIEWWVLVSPGEVAIGFLGFANDTIEALFIDPEHHGRGGGKLLVAHAQALAVGGALAVDVNEQNETGLGFYRALGFAVTGRSPTDAGGRPFPILHMQRPSPSSSGAEKEAVYTVTDYYDSPRRGVADFRGVPHAYESLFDDSEDEWDSTFLLRPIEPSTLELALEDWQIWLRWRRAFDEGRAALDTHPALPEDRQRHDQIKLTLDEGLRIEPATQLRATGHFEVVDGEWKVSWTPAATSR